MKPSRQRKVIVGLLAAALSALAVDRVFLGSGATAPETAAASGSIIVGDGGDDANANASAESSARASLRPSLAQVAERLNQLAADRALDPTKMRDGFAPSEKWIAPKVTIKPAARADAPSVTPAEAFAREHKLLGVVLDQTTGGAAILTGRRVPLGRSVDGFELVRLTIRSAVFERDGIEVELKLPEPKADKGK